METGFLGLFELKSENDMGFKMQQGMISNYLKIFEKTENNRLALLLQRHIMRYKQNDL